MASALRSSFTDIFIRRPVLATVVALLIVIVGLQATLSLPVRQFPNLTKTTITIMTSYPGADAELMRGFITTPLQQAVASTEGIDTIKSSSTAETSTITINMKLNADGTKALTQVLTKINQVRNVLPREANDPVVTESTGDDFSLLYIGLDSKTMTRPEVTDFVLRVMQPALQAVAGVGTVGFYGEQPFSMRIWLNPDRMAALGITASDVNAALSKNNYISAAGQVKSNYVQTTVQANTDLSTADDFSKLVVAVHGDTLVRLGDIAKVELGAQAVSSATFSNGAESMFVMVKAAPGANPLAVAEGVKKAMPSIEALFPPGLHGKILHDTSENIRASIVEVVKTLAEAAIIVILVIYLFLGSVRSTLIPMVTIPVSLVGVMMALQMMGYSINLLTLLALVLAIGLVVDDAIVVIENIHRHIEEGLSPKEAALIGAREITLPVIAMTITLAAVYAPIGFLGGLTGILFREFAFTLAGAVIISGIIALVLSPMMSSRLLRPESPSASGERMHAADRFISTLRVGYEHALTVALRNRPVLFIIAAGAVVMSVLMYGTGKRELAPLEDNGIIFSFIKGPVTANIDYMAKFEPEISKVIYSIPENAGSFIGFGGMDRGVNSGMVGLRLKPWSQRKRTANQILPEYQKKLNAIPGLNIFAFNFSSLPGGGGGPSVKFVLKTTSDFATLFQVLQEIKAEAQKSGLFLFTDSDLRFDTPQLRIAIDHAKANQLGINMSDIGGALATMLGGNYVNHFNLQGRSYQVIPQAPRDFRLGEDWLGRYQLRTATGEMVPLSTVATISRKTEPNALTTFQQLNSATLQGAPFPGKSLGQCIDFLKSTADRIMPKTFSYDFDGESRQYVQEGNALVAVFGLSIVIIFLVLAAQFESWRDPFIILVAVPLSIFGALLPVVFTLTSINIYTQVGLVTLIGLISKHGILMVEFANRLQESEGLDRHRAIIKAAVVRMRPILMTTAAMVIGVVPLLIATGAGANSRFQIGLTIAMGMTVGTLFTLFVVPAVYSVLAQRHVREDSSDALAQPAE